MTAEHITLEEIVAATRLPADRQYRCLQLGYSVPWPTKPETLAAATALHEKAKRLLAEQNEGNGG